MKIYMFFVIEVRMDKMELIEDKEEHSFMR